MRGMDGPPSSSLLSSSSIMISMNTLSFVSLVLYYHLQFLSCCLYSPLYKDRPTVILFFFCPLLLHYWRHYMLAYFLFHSSSISYASRTFSILVQKYHPTFRLIPCGFQNFSNTAERISQIGTAVLKRCE